MCGSEGASERKITFFKSRKQTARRDISLGEVCAVQNNDYTPPTKNVAKKRKADDSEPKVSNPKTGRETFIRGRRRR